MKTIFLNKTENRLRAGWRIAICVALIFALALPGLQLLQNLYGERLKDTPLPQDIYLVGLAAVSATVAIIISRRLIDKKTVISLGLNLNAQALKDIFFGYLLSGLMAASIFAVMWGAELIEVTGVNFSNASVASEDSSVLPSFASMGLKLLALQFALYVVVSWWEELFFRGYLLQNMIEGMGLLIAVLISCLIYGLVHAMNPNASLLSTAIIILFGFMRLYGYLATKMLWLSFGMHAGWNFFQGPIFGYAASGHKTEVLVQQSPTGPDWLTGGDFGPEGSIITIPVVMIAIGVMWFWSRGRAKQDQN